MSTTAQMFVITPLDTTIAAFRISADDLISVEGINSGANSSISYQINNRKVNQNLQITEAPATIVAAAQNLITATSFVTGNAIYINSARIKKVYASTVTGNTSGSGLVTDTESPSWATIQVTESPSAVEVLVNNVADTIPIVVGAEHITNTTQSTSVSTGALIVDGGAGIAKNVFVGGTLNGATGVNLATASGVTTIGSATPATVSATGVVGVANTTDSTTSTTGSITTAGGVGIAKAIVTGTSITAGTSLAIGTNVTLAKEVDHTITVTTTTTAATAGGALDIVSGAGATSGTGGEVSLKSGAGGDTGAGGVINITSGAGGATSGASGAVNIASGAATVGSSGTITIASGNTASGVAGDIQLTPGTHTSTTVSPVISLNKAVIRKPNTKSAATGTTLTGVELLGGYISVTGATGNLTLPDAVDITTAIGSTPAGTYFDFVVNATNMTATNVVTLVVGANTTAMKQTSAGDSATSQLLTVTQTAGTEVGIFRITFITATTCSLHRIG